MEFMLRVPGSSGDPRVGPKLFIRTDDKKAEYSGNQRWREIPFDQEKPLSVQVPFRKVRVVVDGW